MIILKNVADLDKILSSLRETSKTTGFVPTMGALHEGHLSLIKRAKQIADICICSIFVNPTQFNDPEDFNKYPVTTEKDIELLTKEQVDYLFLPDVDQIYPSGTPSRHYELGKIEEVLEGAHRPGHFQGVAQVLDRLLSIIQPTFIVMGQKDFQQIMVVRRLMTLINSPSKLITAETLRTSTGLAQSSRNARLTADQQLQATAIHKALQFGKAHIQDTAIATLERQMTEQLITAGFESVDYVAFCRASDLSPITQYTPGETTVILVAAFLGGVRLIDNMVI